MAETRIEQISYGGWLNCYRLTRGDLELVVTSDVGPRVIRCGFVGGQNMFAEFADHLGKSGEPHWMARGGHRLWIAPEEMPDTYAPDNGSVAATLNGTGITLLQPTEPETLLQKEITIELSLDGQVKAIHRVENCGSAPRRIALWALTMMAPGGVAFVSFPPRGCHDEHLQPTHPLVMWAYTDFSDRRWQLNEKHLILRQDPRAATPQKAGLFNQKTIAGYIRGTDLFVKSYRADCAATYPDFHCCFEAFTNADFLELETLGPLVNLQPGASVSHVETWSLHSDVCITEFSDAELEAVLQGTQY